ncbi:MAG: ComEA family DNA-binding protein [Clostridia bacterium]|nr:ComEA family DNA-binding protein [Clostridia bacterium]
MKRLALCLAALAVLCVSAGALLSIRPAQEHTYPAGTWRTLPQATEIPLQRGEIPVNWADAESLQALPGIGPVYAQAIIDERERNGPFYYPEDLMDVRGIGKARLAVIRGLIDLSPAPEIPEEED